jgi:hypothetical protein
MYGPTFIMKENRPYTECGGVYNRKSSEYEVIGKFAPSMKEILEERCVV